MQCVPARDRVFFLLPSCLRHLESIFFFFFGTELQLQLLTNCPNAPELRQIYPSIVEARVHQTDDFPGVLKFWQLDHAKADPANGPRRRR